MLGRIRRSKFLQFVLGFTAWLLFWTVFYKIAEATNPNLNLAESITLVLIATAIHPAAILFLFLKKLRWAALGYAAALVLNIVGQFLVFNMVLDAQKVFINGMMYYTRYIHDLGSLLSYLLQSIPFFLPVGFGP